MISPRHYTVDPMLLYWYSYIIYPEYFVCRGEGIASSSFFEKQYLLYWYSYIVHPEYFVYILNILYIFCTLTNIILVLAFITGGCSEGLGGF